MTAERAGPLLLGVDIGTSTVKAVLVERGALRIVQEHSVSLGDHVIDAAAPNAYERSVEDVLSNCLEACLGRFLPETLASVCAIGVCGQMHGCVLWTGELNAFADGKLDFTRSGLDHRCSNLVTWQDGRCTTEFLASLPVSQLPIAISGGYGCATLSWLARHQPDILRQFDRAGTIMDLLVWALCGGGGRVRMSAQNAASWGYFDVSKGIWELEM